MSNIFMIATLGKDPEVKVAASGAARTILRVAETVNGGKDNEATHWYNWTVFNGPDGVTGLGANVAASMKKGQRVSLYGRPETYQREVQIDGETKTITETSFVAYEVGADLRFATAVVTKASKGGSQAAPAAAAEPAPAAAPAAAAAAPAAAPAGGSDDDF